MSNSCEFLTTNLITDYEKDGKTSSQSIVLIERAKQAPKFIKGLFPQAKESVEREPPVTSSPGTAVEQTQAILPNSDVFHPVPATETAPDTTEPTSTALGEADGSTQAIETQTDIVVKTSNSTEKIWDRLFASATELFNECFDESFNKLLSSTNLSEVVDAFKIAEFNIGRSEFVTAIMLYKIHEKKIWATIGYTSLSGFLRDLPDSCKLSRQGFYNAVNSGYVLHNFQFFSNSEKNRGFLSLDMLKSNYSKLHLLFPIVKNKQMDRAIIRMKDDIVYHFLNDSYDAFKNYLNQVSNKKPRPQNIIRTDCVKTVKSVPAALDALDGVRKEIYDAIQNERIVAVLSGATPSVVASVKQYIEARRQREIATANKKLPDAKNLLMKCEDGSKKPVIDCDVSSEFIKDWPKLNIEILGGLPDQLSPQGIKDVLSKYSVNKTEYMLAEAYILENIAQKSSKEQNNNLLSEQFATDALKLGKSQYKKLRQIGNGLTCLDNLNMKIKISSEGFTEKLRYLKRALNNHPGDASQVVAYLNSLSTRLFIDYAKNSNYEFSRILPSRKAYKIVLPYLNKYDELLNKSGSVDIIILDSKTEFEWVEHIQGWTRWGEPTFKSKYPDMPWPCEFWFDILLNDESNAIKDFDLLSEPVPVYSLLEEAEEAVKITEKEMAEAA